MPLFGSSRTRSQVQTNAQDPPIDDSTRNPPPPPRTGPTDAEVRRNTRNNIPKCKVGERYKVPGTEFDEDSDDDEGHPEWWYAVVTDVMKTCTKMWFKDDDDKTRYNGFLGSWRQYLHDPDDATAEEEAIYQDIEIAAKLRRSPRARVPRLRPDPGNNPGGSSSGSGDSGEDLQVDGPCQVDAWESDLEDDECLLEPDVDADEADLTLDAQYERAQWSDVVPIRTDPRAVTGSMPENITPAFLMPSYRDEPLLSWFLFYMSLPLVVLIVKATNEAAKDIAWPRNQPWKHLRTGEFLRWLGLWMLMTIYPIGFGGRRACWRGIFKFTQCMTEHRFENILRCFTLPQYKQSDSGWGGQGRAHYLIKKFDKFQEVRFFTDKMRQQFQDALKPGGWLCIDESMFSWLGRALKLPGWKIIKRKPHPIGLESKTTACAVVGVLIDFEFQEGTLPMGFFKYIDETNRSSAWLLRLTEKWHNKEERTVIADAAFAQVRAAVALRRTAGLHLIGNVKGCTKYFCKAELKEECPAYERDKLVCVTKKLTLGVGSDAVTIYGTGWRCTGEMVVTYVHTCGTTVMGSDRVKRKYAQMSDGKVTSTNYHVKRPKVSSEYQSKMGAIDGHNYRRQSSKSTLALEKVCVTRNTKDRIFISIVSWVLINIYLLQKFFLWGGEAKKTPSELQEQIAMALINNKLLEEADQDADPDNENDLPDFYNDPEDCKKHPDYKTNLCRVCYKHNTVYICDKCSVPTEKKLRKEKGKQGRAKYTQGGFMHFCRHGGCFEKHNCGHVPKRRSKEQMQKDRACD